MSSKRKSNRLNNFKEKTDTKREKYNKMTMEEKFYYKE